MHIGEECIFYLLRAVWNYVWQWLTTLSFQGVFLQWQILCQFHVVITEGVHTSYQYMMTSSNGNIFRVTGLCEGNSPVTGKFPSLRQLTRSFDVFFDLQQTVEYIIETPVIETHRVHDVIVMNQNSDVNSCLVSCIRICTRYIGFIETWCCVLHISTKMRLKLNDEKWYICRYTHKLWCLSKQKNKPNYQLI